MKVMLLVVLEQSVEWKRVTKKQIEEYIHTVQLCSYMKVRNTEYDLKNNSSKNA